MKPPFMEFRALPHGRPVTIDIPAILGVMSGPMGNAIVLIGGQAIAIDEHYETIRDLWMGLAEFAQEPLDSEPTFNPEDN